MTFIGETVRQEVQKALTEMRAGMIAEVRNLLLGQANVMHNLTLGQINALHAQLREEFLQTAARFEDLSQFSRTRLMTADLMSEMLCLIDLKYRQYEKALEESERRLEEKFRAWTNPLESRHRTTHAGERLVEIPFTLEHLAKLPKGSRVIGLGGAEGIPALTMAALGHEVHAVDCRPCPVPHPRLKLVAQSVEAWDGPAEPVDAIFCISALEGVAPGADFDIMRRFRQWLKPAGLMVFTAPYGPRARDAAEIAELFAGWTVLETRYYQCSPERDWVPAGADAGRGSPETGAVVLIAARC